MFNKFFSTSKFINNQLITFIVTIGNIGKVKFAPGTIASIYGMSVILLIDYFINKINNLYIELGLYVLFLIIPLFVLGTVFSDKYVELNKQEDPKEVVIDELLGIIITYVGCKYSLYFFSLPPQNLLNTILIPLILFRIFDILKPWPISYVDKNVKGGIGIMLDDVLAAFASVGIYILYQLYIMGL